MDNTGLTNFLSFCGPDHAHASTSLQVTIKTNLLAEIKHQAPTTTFPLLLLQLHQQQQLLSININDSTNHHLQRAKLRILLQRLTSHAAYERSGGPPKRPATKRPCIYLHIHGTTAVCLSCCLVCQKECTNIRALRESPLEVCILTRCVGTLVPDSITSLSFGGVRALTPP